MGVTDSTRLCLLSECIDRYLELELIISNMGWGMENLK